MVNKESDFIRKKMYVKKTWHWHTQDIFINHTVHSVDKVLSVGLATSEFPNNPVSVSVGIVGLRTDIDNLPLK